MTIRDNAPAEFIRGPVSILVGSCNASIEPLPVRAFGTVAEVYVRPERRSRGVGLALMAEARGLASTCDWCRREVTTPPLPEFAMTLAFCEREGFSIAGGRKLTATV
jgi:GNAT superfamily N-acetyltransferase